MTGPHRVDIGRMSVLAVVLLGALALLTKDQWTWIFSPGSAQTRSVEAPTIDSVDVATQRLYRISAANGSEVRYEVTERLAGVEGLVVGTTEVVAGDILIDTVDPSASEIGTIVVNVEMFESGSRLRDKRLRNDFLDSTEHPFVTFEPTSVTGFPATFLEDTSYDIDITGDLTVKETTAPTTFRGTVEVGADRLAASMTATVLMSTFGVGPIHISGLVHTDDELTLGLELVADRVDLTSSVPSADNLGRDLLVAIPPAGAFAESVQPILEKSCVSCHGAGGSGWSTISMDTAGEAAEIADDIALVTGSLYMPPWPASDLGVELRHDWSLSQDQIDVLAGWAASGGGIDVAADAALVARPADVETLERDLVLPPQEPYVGSTDLPDDYRCQIIRVPDPEDDGTWIRGFSFEPDKDEIVHHSIVFRADAAQMAAAVSLDAAEPGAGWQCFGLSGLGGRVFPIAGWAPGMQPTIYPDGVGLRLQPGEFLINQIHYHYEDTTPADSSAIVLDTLTPAEIAAAGGRFAEITGRFYLTPAEIPCTPDEDGPLCDRGAALVDIASKYGRRAAAIPDTLIGRCGGTVSDYDRLTGTKSHSSCDLDIGNAGTIFSVLGHMHEIGSAYRMTLNPGGPDEKILLDIPKWSFDWQFYYEPVEEISVDRSDIVRLECTWDRSLRHYDEPRYVTWNDGTVDEMCFSSIQVIPASG